MFGRAIAMLMAALAMMHAEFGGYWGWGGAGAGGGGGGGGGDVPLPPFGAQSKAVQAHPGIVPTTDFLESVLECRPPSASPLAQNLTWVMDCKPFDVENSTSSNADQVRPSSSIQATLSFRPRSELNISLAPQAYDGQIRGKKLYEDSRSWTEDDASPAPESNGKVQEQDSREFNLNLESPHVLIFPMVIAEGKRSLPNVTRHGRQLSISVPNVRTRIESSNGEHLMFTSHVKFGSNVASAFLRSYTLRKP